MTARPGSAFALCPDKITRLKLVQMRQTPTLRSISVHKHSTIMSNAKIIIPRSIIQNILPINGVRIDSRNRAACDEPGQQHEAQTLANDGIQIGRHMPVSIRRITLEGYPAALSYGLRLIMAVPAPYIRRTSTRGIIVHAVLPVTKGWRSRVVHGHIG